MEETEESRSDLMQRLQSSFGASPSSVPKPQPAPSLNRLDLPHLNTSQIRAPFRNFSQNFSPENSKRPAGIPPSHPNIPPASPSSYLQSSPYSQIPASSRSPSQQPTSHNFSPVPSHSRSLSQPAFFSLESLPPLSPSPYRDSPSTSLSDPISVDVSMEERDGNSHALQRPPSPYSTLPPRKAHRRSRSEIPFGFSIGTQSLPTAVSPNRGVHGFLDRSASAKENLGMAPPAQLVKRESDWDREGEGNAEGTGERKSEGEVVEDLFSAFMNLDNMDNMDNMDALTSSGTEDKQFRESHEDLDSRASGTRASGTKTNGVESSDNEAESSVNESGISSQVGNIGSSMEKKEGNKRSAGGRDGDLNVASSRHCRSVSMDSFMGKMHHSFGDESPKMPPSPGNRGSQHSHSNSMDGTSSAFSLEFGNGEFSGPELKKIMANEKLAEIALADPKRAKRILANRQSAARSKERKMRYISELEHKVQTLQTEATTLSAQLTLLQRDSAGLNSQNSELKFRLQAMEQQAQLRDALNEALSAEVQRLKLATAELGEAHTSNNMSQQLPMNAQMFQLQRQHPSQLSIYQMQQHQQQQNGGSTKRESSQ